MSLRTSASRSGLIAIAHLSDSVKRKVMLGDQRGHEGGDEGNSVTEQYNGYEAMYWTERGIHSVGLTEVR